MSTGAAAPSTDVLTKVKSIKGTTLIATLCVMLSLVFVVNFFAARRNNELERKQRADAVYGAHRSTG
jgi:uncharacterized membrane protein